MSRSGYIEDDGDYEGADWAYIRWSGALKSAIRGKRGQALLRELLASLDALPEKKLIANSFLEPQDGAVCALGALGKTRGTDLAAEFGDIDPEDNGAAADAAAGVFDMSHTLAREIMAANDENGPHAETPEQRYTRMLRWIERQLIEWGAAGMTVNINGKRFKVLGALPPAEKPKRRNKFGNRKVVVDGIKFDSQRESKRWAQLCSRSHNGFIRDLVLQPTFILAPAVRIAGEARKRPAMRYTADFQYVDAKTGEIAVEDVKSVPTAKAADFRMRQHLMATVHGISVRVIL